MFKAVTFSQYNEPREEQIEKEDWVHSESFPIGWYHSLDEMDWGVGRPDESHANISKFYQDVNWLADAQVDDCCDI